MNVKSFIDTNIFVYTFSAVDADKCARARTVIHDGLASGNGVISYQVVQEFLNVGTRKFTTPLAASEAKQYLRDVLQPMCEVYPNEELYLNALSINEDYQYSLYDSLIIASAQRAKCRVLYTEDLQHEQKIGDLKILNPFI